MDYYNYREKMKAEQIMEARANVWKDAKRPHQRRMGRVIYLPDQ